MTPEAQLEWEARAGRLAAIAAFLGAALVVGGTVFRQAVALAGRPDDDRQLLVALHDHSGSFLASSIVLSLSFFPLAGVLVYLYRLTKARKPDFPAFAFALAILGPVLLAVAGPLLDLHKVDIADDFVASGARTIKRAKDLLDDQSVAAAAVGSGGALAMAFSMVLICINSMRVGILSRFMGVIGAVIGGLYVLPILAGPFILIVQLFWLIAIGMLFLGKWPRGRGPAWETGEAVPWPTAADARAEAALEAEPEPEAEPSPNPRSSRKRKRKKRR